MADGKTHFAVSSVAAGVAAIALLAVGSVSREGVLILFASGIVGGMLPDIDSGHSPSINAAWSLAGVLVSFLVVFSQVDHFSVMELTLLWLAVYLAFRVILLRLLLRLTTHRGMIHSVPMAMISGLLAVLLFHYWFRFSLSLSWLAAGFVFLGFIGHLLLDELYSLNLFGAGQRMALGSAFKFFSKEWRISLLAWLLVGGLIWLVPEPAGALDSFLQPAYWHKIKQRMLPAQGWFFH
ncbi:MAG: hypothetical protein G8345_21930 [Magnetococcales bacterium]|nr:hypothetical protein [Magnetococcales bacterium]